MAEQKLSTAAAAKSSSSSNNNKEDSTATTTTTEGGLTLPLPTLTTSPLPSTKRSSSSHHHHLPPDSQDSIILRARVIRFKHLAPSGVGVELGGGGGGEEEEGAVFAKLKGLVTRISDPAAKEEALRQSLWEIAQLFVGGGGGGGDGAGAWVRGGVVRGKGGDETPSSLSLSDPSAVSSFEVLQSGLVDGLLEFATVKERAGGRFHFLRIGCHNCVYFF